MWHKVRMHQKAQQGYRVYSGVFAAVCLTRKEKVNRTFVGGGAIIPLPVRLRLIAGF